MKSLHNENKGKKKEFVRTVLKKWISAVGGPAVPCTWKSLIKVMKSADMDEIKIQDIKANVC